MVTAVTARIAQRQLKRPLRVFTPNAEQLVQAADLVAFKRALDAAEIRVPDSVGIVMADWWRAFSKGTEWRIRERVAGVDLAEALLSKAATTGWKVVLIGGHGSTAAKAVVNLKKRFKGLRIWGVGEVEVEVINHEARITRYEARIVEKINQIQPDLVLVGLGAPKQELWTLKYGQKLGAKVIMVVGGAIEMWAGVQKRAPQWMRQIGLEWLWRLIQQPWRLGRQLRLIRFVGLVARGKV